MGAMSRIISDTHPDVYMEEGDSVIFSSKMIPGNEKTYRLQNEIVKKNINLITEENAFVHVSGHPNEMIKGYVRLDKPNCVIPVLESTGT